MSKVVYRQATPSFCGAAHVLPDQPAIISSLTPFDVGGRPRYPLSPTPCRHSRERDAGEDKVDELSSMSANLTHGDLRLMTDRGGRLIPPDIGSQI